MPRFVVERTFPGGLAIAANAAGAKALQAVVAENAALGVTWLHSYVSTDRTRAFDVYDGPNSEAVRRAADHNHLPIDRVTPVTVLDPYFYPGVGT